MDNNPVYLMDPNGDSTFVSKVFGDDGKWNGSYKVWGGTLDDNNEIFIKDQTTNKLGDQIGYSATPESFYNSDEGKWMGTINPNDNSGRNFLNNMILSENPSIPTYAPDATGGGKYDFKRTNGTNGVLFNTSEEFYRGMPINFEGSDPNLPVFASARDVGNMGAGIVSARNGTSWFSTRLAFDALEIKQKHGFWKTFWLYPVFLYESESSSTQFAERLGWRIGRDIYIKEEMSRMPGNGHLRNHKISLSILTRDDWTP